MFKMQRIRLDIPEKGRTCRDTLDKLTRIGWVDLSLTDEIKEVLVKDKARIKQQAKTGKYSSSQDIKINPFLKPYLHLQPDMVRRGSPLRVMFNLIELQTPSGLQVLIRGISHDNAPQELKSHKTDIAICGWDEFYASLIYDLDEQAQHLGKWPGFNRWVKENSQEGDDVRIRNYHRTHVKVAGSAGLEDFVGHFFIFPKEKRQELLSKDGDVKLGNINKIYIDPKFTAVYKAILARHNPSLYDKKHILFPEGKEIELVDVENVEDASMKYRGIGIEIVQSGYTLKKKDLAMVSLPLLQSETIIAHTILNEDSLDVLKQLSPLRYDSSRRQESYRNWYSILEKELGDNWLDKPTLNEMNVDKRDSVTWVPSYSKN